MERLSVNVAGATIQPSPIGLAGNKRIMAVKCGGGNKLFERVFEKTKTEAIQVGIRGQSGQGNTVITESAEAFSLQNYLEDFKEVMTSVGKGPAPFYGYSHGGYFAISFALANPKMVSSLILIEPAWNIPKEELEERIELLNRPTEAAGVEGITKMLQFVSPGLGATEAVQSYAQDISKDWQSNQAIAAEFRVRAENPITEEQLVNLKVPTLLIYGTNSAIKHLSIDAAKIIPNASLWAVDGADHLDFDRMERKYADELSDVISLFIEKWDR